MKSDNELLELYLRGSESSFNEIYKRYYKLVRAISWNYSNTKTENHVDDLSQAIWFKVIINLKAGRYKLDTVFASWITTLAKRKCIDIVYRKRGETREEPMPKEWFVDFYHKTDCDIESDIEKKQLISEIVNSLDSLTDNQKVTLMLRLRDYTYIQISGMIKVPYGTLAPAYVAAIFKLRTALQAKGIIGKTSSDIHNRKMFKRKSS